MKEQKYFVAMKIFRNCPYQMCTVTSRRLIGVFTAENPDEAQKKVERVFDEKPGEFEKIEIVEIELNKKFNY